MGCQCLKYLGVSYSSGLCSSSLQSICFYYSVFIALGVVRGLFVVRKAGWGMNWGKCLAWLWVKPKSDLSDSPSSG